MACDLAARNRKAPPDLEVPKVPTLRRSRGAAQEACGDARAGHGALASGGALASVGALESVGAPSTLGRSHVQHGRAVVLAAVACSLVCCSGRCSGHCCFGSCCSAACCSGRCFARSDCCATCRSDCFAACCSGSLDFLVRIHCWNCWTLGELEGLCAAVDGAGRAALGWSEWPWAPAKGRDAADEALCELPERSEARRGARDT